MAHVEEKKLLRALITTTALALCAGSVLAEEPVLQFAPGAQGFIEPSIPDMLDRSEKLGESWSEGLDIQAPDNFGRSFDMEGFRDKALSHPRVREMLGVDEGSGPTSDESDRWGSTQVFLLASFSMPAPALRAMMVEASSFDVPILFRGFVNNSVFETQAAFTEVFGEEADVVGFGIDPTLFTRFEVETVPQVIVTSEPLDVCETSGCEGDTAPKHDRVAGNIPLKAALEIIARGDGDAAEAAFQTLAMSELGS